MGVYVCLEASAGSLYWVHSSCREWGWGFTYVLKHQLEVCTGFTPQAGGGGICLDALAGSLYWVHSTSREWEWGFMS